MIVTNQTSSDIYFGPLHLAAGIGAQLTIDDTTATSLYLTNDSVADAVNNAYNSNKITVTSQAQPFPRPTGTPSILHGTGNPEGLVYAPQGSIYMRRDGLQTNGGVIYEKTTGLTFNTGWIDIPTASGATAALPPGTITAFAASAAPAGWLVCDGSAMSRSVYSVLFGVISTAYGVGDGSTTFNLPDMRGRAPVGYVASGGHSDVSTLANNEGVTLPIRRPRHYHSLWYWGGAGANAAPYLDINGGYFTNNTNAQNTNAIGPDINGTGPFDTPAYLVVNYIIKT